jgi:hypothetical protein
MGIETRTKALLASASILLNSCIGMFRPGHTEASDFSSSRAADYDSAHELPPLLRKESFTQEDAFDMRSVCSTPPIKAAVEIYYNLGLDNSAPPTRWAEHTPPGEDTVILYKFGMQEDLIRQVPDQWERDAIYQLHHTAFSHVAGLLERTSRVAFLAENSEAGQDYLATHPDAHRLRIVIANPIPEDPETKATTFRKDKLIVFTNELYELKLHKLVELFQHESVHLFGSVSGHAERIFPGEITRQQKPSLIDGVEWIDHDFSARINPNTTTLMSPDISLWRTDGFPEIDLCLFAEVFGAREGSVPPPENKPWVAKEHDKSAHHGMSRE